MLMVPGHGGLTWALVRDLLFYGWWSLSDISCLDAITYLSGTFGRRFEAWGSSAGQKSSRYQPAVPRDG